MLPHLTRSRAVVRAASRLRPCPRPAFTARAYNYNTRLHRIEQEADMGERESDSEFVRMLLQASPSGRDAKGYLTSFAPPTEAEVTTALAPSPADDGLAPSPNPLVETVLNPILQRPALVKIQGPFSDTQLRSVANGIHHLQKLGLVSVVVIDRDDIPPFESSDPVAAEAQRELMLRDTERVVHFLTRGGAPARPILSTVTRIKGETAQGEGDVYVEAEGLDHVRRAVEEGEIPVLMPVALDEGCRARRIPANAVLCALAEAMANGTSSSSVLVQNEDGETSPKPESSPDGRMDITPARLLIINREGGIPSYARNGFPHLSINLASELDYITNTWQDAWRQSHPTSLSNLALADACLSHMPRNASALIVSHRSPAALISNLITNKPAHSASLPHALLTQSEGRVTRDTPTLIRQGLPVRILRNVAEIDKAKLTHLLETSFGRKLSPAYWSRLERDLDFVIVVGDYAGAAITTTEGRGVGEAICYLDKFAVLPSHQGDGTVDFLWVGLRDETYGLGLLDAANPSEGSLSGVGRGRDLIWRSRADNGVNKWYFERSNGFTLSADGRWKMFWCDAEQRLQELSQENGGVMRVVEASEAGRLARWAPVIEGIKSAWSD